jgi:hypothetical protein
LSGVKIPENLLLILAAGALGIAIIQEIHPFALRVQPGIMIVVALLLTLRWALRKQRRKRVEMLQEVPQKPLGLSDE